MKKIQLIFISLLLGFALSGCEDVFYYESDQFEIMSFNNGLNINGYKEEYYLEDLVIHDEITYFNTRTGKHETGIIEGIWYNAFQNMNLRSITITTTENSEFTTIYSYAFADNENLISVILPSSIIDISNNAFANNPKLEIIDLHDLEILGDYAFSGCIKLKEIKLGSKIKSIGDYAFENNHDDLTIYISNPIPPKIGMNIFKGVNNFKIVVPQEYLEIYRTSNDWSEYVNQIYTEEQL